MYNDSNQNGIKDSTEDGVSDIIIQAKSCTNDRAVALGFSRSDGEYRLPDIGPPGCYFLEFVADDESDYTFISPENGRTEEIYLESGQADFSWDAGIVPTPTPRPTTKPVTNAPTNNPVSSAPTERPSAKPVTSLPSLSSPSAGPSVGPSTRPSRSPSTGPTVKPTLQPVTDVPSTSEPTTEPSATPSKVSEH